jgi:hypothetical protein
VEVGAFDGATYSNTVFLAENGWRGIYIENRKIRVPVQTLHQILFSYDIEPEFDLLVVDVEHHEMKVLKGFDLNYWKPKMCIVETHEGQVDPMVNFMAPAINEYFMNYGYNKIHFDAINSIFVR